MSHIIRLAIVAAAAASYGCNPEARVARDLETACDGGDVAACNDLGWMTRQGEHVVADWRRAADLFRMACEGGVGDACVRLGRLHVHPSAAQRGVPHDSATAALLFAQGCDTGGVSGCTDLADMYLADDAVAAARLYGYACDGGHMTACTRLGLLVARGVGVDIDSVRAAELHRRSCDGGSSLGCAHLGRSYETGLGAEVDLERAATLYRQSCETEMVGCFRLADLTLKGAGVEQDVERAFELFAEACLGTRTDDVGSAPVAESCFRAGDMVVNGVVDRPLSRASSFFRSACSLGFEEACGRP